MESHISYEDLMEQIKSKYKEGDWDAVFDYIDKFIEENPNSFEAYLVRSELNTEAGAFENALYDAEKAVEINPNEATVYNNRGCVYVRSGGDINRALNDFNKAIELNANFVEAYTSRANVYLKMREPQKAIDDCTKAIEISQENAEPYYNRGLAYANIGEIAKAVYDYNKVIELDPQNAEAYAKRGYLNSQLGNMQETIRDYEEFLRLDPNNKNAALVRDELEQMRSNKAPSSVGTSSGGCYIATAVYGSYDAPEVLCLRRFRDEILAASIFGRLFIRLYYFLSPPIAERLKDTQCINAVVRKMLDMFTKARHSRSRKSGRNKNSLYREGEMVV
jgi:tetratricopeptide (TPR) repeat protein